MVTRYNLRGFVENLPHMITKRQDHGCAGFQQEENLVYEGLNLHPLKCKLNIWSRSSW